MKGVETFYMVWCPTGPYSPRRRHSNPERATEAAKDMARRHQGEAFFVMRAIGFAQYRGTVWEELEDDIPF